jgi:short-subunit dehydrogenase
MEWRGKHVVITGASSGIGRATALELARRGARLSLAARREPLLIELASLCHGRGGEAAAIVTNVQSEESCIELARRAESRFGPIDVLVNNAGFAVFDTIAAAATSDLHAMMETNYFGAVHCTKAVLPSMLERKSGAIVNVASITGIMGFAGMGGYCASKFALIGFSEALRDEVIGSGVGVSVVCPGTTETEFFVTADRAKMPGASRLIVGVPPERVARAIIRAAESGRARTIVPLSASAYMRMKEMSPAFAHLMMRRVSRWLEKSDRSE